MSPLTDQAFEQESELEALRKSQADLQRKLKAAKAKTDDLVAAIYQGAKDACLVMGKPPAVPKAKVDRRKRPEVAMLHLSDLHFGKETPSFNSGVAAERLDLLITKVEKITEIERADHPVNEARLLLGGDLAENLGIFPGQVYEVDSTMFEQVFAAALAIEKALRRLLALCSLVAVDEVGGNHGRIGRKGDNPAGDNVDRLIGAIVRERFTAELASGRLCWKPLDNWYRIVEIGNYRALLIHGDQIKSFGGNTPAFGIARKANAWASGVLGEQFTDVLMGHFHSPLVVPLANGKGRAFVSPSVESDSHYAQEFVAATGTPSQRLFFVDPEKGRITSERLVYLDA